MHPRYRISHLAAQHELAPAEFVARSIEKHGGVAEAAKALGVTEQAVWHWVHKEQMQVEIKVRVIRAEAQPS